MFDYHEWTSPKGRYCISWGGMGCALPLYVSNGSGGFSVNVLWFDITRWKGSAANCLEGKRWMDEDKETLNESV